MATKTKKVAKTAPAEKPSKARTVVEVATDMAALLQALGITHIPHAVEREKLLSEFAKTL